MSTGSDPAAAPSENVARSAGIVSIAVFLSRITGLVRETVMAHYLSNHIAVAYGDIFGEMVAASLILGFKVRVLADWLGKT